MVNDPRTFIKVDDGLPEHPKIVGLSDKAFRMLIELWAYSSRQLTDGRVPLTVWNRSGTARARAELLSAGLAHEGPGRIQMHDYLEWQRSREHVEAIRRVRAEAGKKGGRPKANGKQIGLQTESNLPSNLPSKRKPKPNPETEGLLRNPYTETDLVQSQAPAPTAQTLVGEWIDHCEAKPPARVVGQIAKEVAAMLSEGIAYERVRAGLQAWQQKSLHPSALASVVHEVANPPKRRSTTDQRAAQGLALVQHFEELERKAIQ